MYEGALRNSIIFITYLTCVLIAQYYEKAWVKHLVMYLRFVAFIFITFKLKGET